MSMHKQLAEILREQQQNPLPDPALLPIAEARHNFERNASPWNQPLPPMTARDVRLGEVECEFLAPEQAGRGLILLVHGGGWTFGSPATHARFARLLAEQTKAAVLVPDYRLAPEHPAPAGILDVLAVIADLDQVAPDAPLVLAGDSAGANIALAAAIAGPARKVALLSLAYGCFAPIFDTESHRRCGDGSFGLSTQRMRWYWSNWLGAEPDSRAVPLDGDLTGLPPCHLLAAALDPLCDDSLLLAGRLAASGVATRLDIVPGVNHGFLQMTARLDPAMTATATIAAVIAERLNHS